MTRYQPLATLTLLVALLSLTACEELAAPELATAPSPAAAASPTETGGDAMHEGITRGFTRHELYLGTSTALRGERRVSFDDVGPDSRCPIGVDCVHAGEVAARFTVTTPHGAVPFELTLPGGDPKGLPHHEAPWASVDGLLVYLVRLSPYPVAGGDGAPPVESLGDAVDDAVGGADPVVTGSPRATLIVRPCPNTGQRCAGGTGPDPAPPVLTTIRSADGGLAMLTFRTDEGVPLSDEPLLLAIGEETFEVPLQAGPARFTEPGGTVVDQASYALNHATLDTLMVARHADVTVSAALAGTYVEFPYVSGDLIESDEPVE